MVATKGGQMIGIMQRIHLCVTHVIDHVVVSIKYMCEQRRSIVSRSKNKHSVSCNIKSVLNMSLATFDAVVATIQRGLSIFQAVASCLAF